MNMGKERKGLTIEGERGRMKGDEEGSVRRRERVNKGRRGGSLTRGEGRGVRKGHRIR